LIWSIDVETIEALVHAAVDTASAGLQVTVTADFAAEFASDTVSIIAISAVVAIVALAVGVVVRESLVDGRELRT
jgi:hypothetical protein